MEKFSKEYIEAKRLKEKERQRKYYMTVTKIKRKKLWTSKTSQTLKK